MRISSPHAGTGLMCRPIGAALLVHPQEGPAGTAVELARTLPPEPGHTVVVVDPPEPGGPALVEELAALVPDRGPLRLVLSRAGSGGPGSLAHALAERKQTEVIAPDGVVHPVPGGFAFVADGAGWLRFRPGAPPRPAGLRYPVPAWEPGTPLRRLAPGPGLVVEPIPAGLWLRPESHPDPAPVFDLPCQAEMLTVVLEPSVPVPEVCRLLAALPASARTRVRLMPHGTHERAGEPVGQLVADAFGASLTVHTGLIEWAFATVLSYWPRRVPMPAVPKVVRYRAPLPGLAEPHPGVFRLTDDIIVETVQSGLWVRGGTEPMNGGEIRAVPLDPHRLRVTVGEPGTPPSRTLADAAAGLVERLEPAARQAAQLIFAEAPLEEEEPVTQWMRVETEPTAETPEVPGDDRIAPDHRSGPAEHEWLRRTLGSRFDSYASAVSRLLAQRPGLRGEEETASFSEAVITDLVAVRAYAEGASQSFDQALRTGTLGAFRPYAGCIVSGLRRLPTHRGPVLTSATLDDAQWARYRVGEVLTERGLLHALATPFVELPGAVEFFVLALTARRTGFLTGGEGPEQQRVIFPPDTRFKVLAVTEGRVLLREVTGADGGRDQTALDRLTEVAANRDTVAPRRRQELETPARFDHPLGLT
ncbi:hypothetical protein ACFWY9_12945 [Amycolatopsis sp. NPDC059027]|uniref:hypothetical protein n=1 Tax=Amycolatopsis sp. NPDC059027 TaxID=3346709 RepID=UPI0036700B62